MYEGGFVLKWYDWAKHVQSIQNERFAEPDKIPDSVDLKELLAVVFLC